MTQSASKMIYFVILLGNLGKNLRVVNEIMHKCSDCNWIRKNKHDTKNKKFDPKTRIPFDNIVKYYETAFEKVTIKNELIKFHIAIPMILENPYTLYRINPIPMNNQIVLIYHPYLKNEYNFYNSKENCKKID